MKIPWQACWLMIPVVSLSAWQLDRHSHNPKKAMDSSWSELMESMERMHAAQALLEPSGDRDADFARLMLPHHQAAVEMAKSELLHGKDPQIRRLAQEIITDQQSEIELMQIWLKRGAFTPEKSHENSPRGEGVRKGAQR